MSQPPRTSLLGLPTELRLSIFEWALHHTSIKLRHRKSLSSSEIRNPWAYLQLNRQIRHEILPTFYEKIQFQLLDGLNLEKLSTFFETIGSEAISRIRRVEFNCKGKCTMYGLQPDTDWCHRVATLDLSAQPIPNRVELKRAAVKACDPKQLCSNDAHGCSSLTLLKAWTDLESASHCMKGDVLDVEVIDELLLSMFNALEIDNSSSTA